MVIERQSRLVGDLPPGWHIPSREEFDAIWANLARLNERDGLLPDGRCGRPVPPEVHWGPMPDPSAVEWINRARPGWQIQGPDRPYL